MGNPLFDFDGNGRMDALELLSALKGDPSNPLSWRDDESENDDTEDDFDCLFDDEDE